MPKAKVLIADDEERMRRLIKDFLVADGCAVFEADDGQSALDIFYAQKDIDLVILDVMMPNMNGWEACREIRNTSRVPIIMLTALSQENDEVMGFNLGADEYIAKPFSPKILLARVNALLRRALGDKEEVLTLGPISIDRGAHTVTVDGEEVYLSLKEYELLLYLVENAGITVSREKILDSVWTYDYDGDARTIDTHVTKLRRKLGAATDMIQTVRGVGYKIEAVK